MNEEMNNNQEPKTEELNQEIQVNTENASTEIQSQEVPQVVEDTMPQQVQQTTEEQPVQEEPLSQEVPSSTVEFNPTQTENEPKKNNKTLIIIIIAVLAIIGVVAFLFFGTDIFKSKENNNKESDDPPTPVATDETSKFEGIYQNVNDKIYIHKLNDTEFTYMIGGNFQGTAKAKDGVAKEDNKFGTDEYFEFKLIDDGIELSYHADENTEVAAETGLYKKVAEYSKDNIYKEAVGDPSYLTSKYSGIYSNGEIQFYVYQKNDKEVQVSISESNSKFFSELFEIESDNHLVAKSFFHEDEIAYEITFNDKSFDLKVNSDIFGVDEDDKELELTYSYEKEITQEEILDEFYSYY